MGRGAEGAAGAARGVGAEGGGGAEGAMVEAATGTAEVVFREGGGIGAGGSLTGAVAERGAGGGRGAEGSCTGAVAFFAEGGRTEEVVDLGGTPPVAGLTGAVASRGWVTPAPGRARRVIRTVSFFSGTAAVFGVVAWGGVGFSGSLMVKGCGQKKCLNATFSENRLGASILFSAN